MYEVVVGCRVNADMCFYGIKLKLRHSSEKYEFKKIHLLYKVMDEEVLTLIFKFKLPMIIKKSLII